MYRIAPYSSFRQSSVAGTCTVLRSVRSGLTHFSRFPVPCAPHGRETACASRRDGAATPAQRRAELTPSGRLSTRRRWLRGGGGQVQRVRLNRKPPPLRWVPHVLVLQQRSPGACANPASILTAPGAAARLAIAQAHLRWSAEAGEARRQTSACTRRRPLCPQATADRSSAGSAE